jgi:hypothetical protein
MAVGLARPPTTCERAKLDGSIAAPRAELEENARTATTEANSPQSTIANSSPPGIPFSERTAFELA